MTGSYEMVDKNGDAETGGIGSDDVIVDVNDGQNSVSVLIHFLSLYTRFLGIGISVKTESCVFSV